MEVKKEWDQKEMSQDTTIPLLRELADLYGQRGCCKKKTCYHHKAKMAIDRIQELEAALAGVCKSMECYQFIVEPIKPEKNWDEYDYMMQPLWIKAHEALTGIKIAMEKTCSFTLTRDEMDSEDFQNRFIKPALLALNNEDPEKESDYSFILVRKIKE